jgi:hypothetical protein
MVKPPTFKKLEDRKLGIFLDDEQTEAQIAKWFDEDFEKLDKLCDIYEVTDGPDKYKYLALALARELFPEPKKKGREKKWGEFAYGCLFVEVNRIIKSERKKRDVESACLILAEQVVWNDFMQDGVTKYTDGQVAESLRKRYYEIRRNVEKKKKAGRGAGLIMDAFYGYEAKGKLDEWPSFVSMILEKPFEGF